MIPFPALVLDIREEPLTGPNPTPNGATTPSAEPYNFSYNAVPGPPGIGGKVHYTKGANPFGGTLSILRNTSNLVIFCQGAPTPVRLAATSCVPSMGLGPRSALRGNSRRSDASAVRVWRLP